MNKTDALDLLDGAYRAAKLLGTSHQNIYQWKDPLSPCTEAQVIRAAIRKGVLPLEAIINDRPIKEALTRIRRQRRSGKRKDFVEDRKGVRIPREERDRA
jgi:hypothetical protein